jgi:hypothetical protein
MALKCTAGQRVSSSGLLIRRPTNERPSAVSVCLSPSGVETFLLYYLTALSHTQH